MEPMPWGQELEDGTWEKPLYGAGFGRWTEPYGVATRSYIVNATPTTTTEDGKLINVTVTVHARRADDREVNLALSWGLAAGGGLR